MLNLGGVEILIITGICCMVLIIVAALAGGIYWVIKSSDNMKK